MDFKENIIHISSLTKYFGKIHALDNLNLEIKKGELLGLIGSNGAGKTTAIRIICGILKPDYGDVVVGGHSVLRDPIRVKSMIGYLPEEPNLYEQFKARDLLRYFGELYGVPKEKIDDRIHELLELVGMKDRADHRINTFSKGLRQRIGIARALIHDPDIIIFDEPTMGLDPATSLSIRSFIEGLKGEKTIILCTHYMDEADALCDRVAILNRGKIRDMGTPDYLKEKIHGKTILQVKLKVPEVDMVRINNFNSVENTILKGNQLSVSLNSKDEIADIVGLVGSNIISVNTKEPTLEDVFIHTVK
ncbi:ABC transporter ATP-binding protein [Methanobacterium sp. ACI-7]|uniref:ABC transporter ATP-binding protein n=1 Tax=unclassified Methanobacterium TaxID=2627676 RepID=UPI0039C3B224